LKQRNDGQCRRLANVVRVGLESQAKHGDLAASLQLPQRKNALRKGRFAQFVVPDQRFDQYLRSAMAPSAGCEGTCILGEARAAETGSGLQEAGADAPVETDPLCDSGDISVQLLAEIRNIVDEADLERQESVGRMLDQFGV